MALPSKSELADSRYWNRRHRAEPYAGFRLLDEEPNRLIPQRWGLFELKTDLAAGGTADAYFRLATDANGNPVSDWTTLVDSSQTTKIRDILGTLSGKGRDSVGGSDHGDYVLAMHDDFYGSDVQSSDVWLAVAATGGQILWGVAQATPVNQSGATQLAVSVKSCQADGTKVIGAAFNVWTPVLGGPTTVGANAAKKYTAIFLGDVVGYVATPQAANPRTIVTDCWDDPFGTIRLLYTDGSVIPNGWTEITGTLDAHFPMVSSGPAGVLTAAAGHHHALALTATCLINVPTNFVVTTSPTGDTTAPPPANVSVRAIVRTS